MRFSFSIAVLAFAGLASGQLSPENDFVLSGAKAYGMLDPDVVAGSKADNLQWSDDGKYVFATRTDRGSATGPQSMLTKQVKEDPTEQSIVVYSMADRKATVVWRAKASVGQVRELNWFKNSDSGIAIVVERMRTIEPTKLTSRVEVLLIDARSASARPILTVDQQGGRPEISSIMSPAKAIGLLTLQDLVAEASANGSPAPPVWHFMYRTVLPDGSLSPVIRLGQNVFVTGWTQNGGSPVINTFSRSSDGKISRSSGILDLLNGNVTPAANPPLFEENPTASVLSVNEAIGTIESDKQSRKVHSFWLVDDAKTSRSMIASDATHVVLSPTLSGIAYVAQGVAMVRPIIDFPKDLYLNMLKSAERTQIISNTKQVGLGLIMFANDNDDAFPNSQQDLNSLLDPYLKNSDLLSGFVYTFGGGLMDDIQDPANTALGYMPGPGGRAVLYSDGHVKWQNDQ